MSLTTFYTNAPEYPFGWRFPTYGDIVGCIASIMDPKNVRKAELVCRAWAKAFSSDPVWEMLINRDLCRGVENATGLKQVYRTLYPKTYGRAMFRKWLGDIDTPVLRADRYNQFFISDDRESFAPKKKFKEAYPLVFIAPHIYRPNDEKPLHNGKTLFTILTEEATEEDKPTITENNEMKIPLTLRNLILLVETLYPKTKIFGYIDPEVLKQCNSAVKKPEAYIMRDEVVLRSTPYPAQKNTVEKTPIGVGKETFKLCPLPLRILYNMFEILERGDCPDNRNPTPLLAGGLYNMFEILERGDCPDNRNPMTYAHTANTIRTRDMDLPVDFGGFAHDTGAVLSYNVANGDHGVSPAVSAEV